MNNVFIVNGLPGSGKTLFGALAGEQLSGRGVDFLHASSIDLVKMILLPEERWDLDGELGSRVDQFRELKRNVVQEDWDGETKNGFWRKAMSDLKAEITEADSNLIHEWVLSQANDLTEPYVVFVDIREPENIEGFKKYCSDQEGDLRVRSVLVESDMGQQFDNFSDGAVLSTEYDIVVRNDRLQNGDDEGRQMQEFRDETQRFIENHVVNRRRSKEAI